MNLGSWISSNLFRKLSLYVLYSFSSTPLNLDSMLYRDTCGMMFSSYSSLKRGGGGSSEVKKRNGDSVTFQSYSPESSASFCLKDPASAGNIFFVWIFIIPRKFLYTMEEVFFLVPPNAMWSEFKNQGRNAPASPCSVI